jgi:hypothetical protein
MIGLTCAAGIFLASTTLSGAGAHELMNPTQPRIVGGTPVEACGWSATAAISLAGGGLCTGTLIADSTLLTAAHCEEPLTAIFGEDSLAGEHYVKLTHCETHPEWTGSNFGEGVDLQVCKLETATSIVPMPIAVGCELDAIRVGTALRAVGFGLTQDGASESDGLKREVEVLVRELAENHEIVVGGDGKDTCQGDSGGPLLVEHADGSWRLLATTSWGGVCGEGGHYNLVASHAAWIEEVAALDVTPCYDAATQVWHPTAACGGFPLKPDTSGEGVWSNDCASPPDQLSPPAADCGPAFDPTSTDTTSSDTSSDSSMTATDASQSEVSTSATDDASQSTDSSTTDSNATDSNATDLSSSTGDSSTSLTSGTNSVLPTNPEEDESNGCSLGANHPASLAGLAGWLACGLMGRRRRRRSMISHLVLGLPLLAIPLQARAAVENAAPPAVRKSAPPAQKPKTAAAKPASTKNGTGFATTKNEVHAGRAIGQVAVQPKASKPSIEIWCPELAQCGPLDGATKRDARFEGRVRLGVNGGAPKAKSIVAENGLALAPKFDDVPYDEGCHSTFAVYPRAGGFDVVELAPQSAGGFRVVRATTVDGDIKALAGAWSTILDASEAGKILKQITHEKAAASTGTGPKVVGAEALAQRKGRAVSPAAEKKARGLWSGLKTDVAPGFIFRVNPDRPECSLKGAYADAWRMNTYGNDVAWAQCIELVSIAEQFHGLDFKWLDDPKRAIDLAALDLVPAVSSQGWVGSCVSWSSGYVAFTNLIWRAAQAKRMEGGDGEKTATPNAINPMHVHRLSKVQSTPANMTVSANASRQLTDYITTTFDRTSFCDRGNAIANVFGLFERASLTLAGASNQLASCEAPFVVSDREKSEHGLNAADIKPRAIDADVDAIRAAIALGSPVVISAPASLFMDYKGGVFAQPASWRDATTGAAWENSINNELQRSGGHAVAVVGFDNTKRALKIQNSWGSHWGDKGYIWVSYDVFNEWTTNLGYYFDCIGACKPVVVEEAQDPVPALTTTISFQAVYSKSWRDAKSAADPRADVYIDGQRVCSVSRENAQRIGEQCTALNLTKGQEFIIYFWEQDQSGYDYVGGIAWAPTANASSRFRLSGGVSGKVQVKFDVKETR